MREYTDKYGPGVLLLICLIIFVVGMVIVAVTANDQPPKNCRETEDTRTQWVMVGKVWTPITQHKYVCTYEEWH